VLGVLLQRTGPYVLLELLLPGGTLFALLLYFFRRQANGCAPVAARGLIGRLVGKLRTLDIVVPTVRLASAHASGCARDGLEPLAMTTARCSCNAGAC
jgi:hypothetical protein